MASLCLLECAVCQQSLTKDHSGDEVMMYSRTSSHDLLAQAHARSRRTPVCTPCGHLFHKGCIAEWFRARRQYDDGSPLRGTCPTCRKMIAYHRLVRIYLTASSSSSEASSSSSTLSFRSTSTAVTTLGSPPTNSNNICDHAHHCPDRFRLYNDFLGIIRPLDGHIRESPQQLAQRHLRHCALVMRLRNYNQSQGLPQEENIFPYDISCENEDCRSLQVLYINLSKEFKALHRKLELERDVSKMKTMLVTSLQRDANKLKMEKDNLSCGAAWFCILMWLLCCLFCFMK